MAKLEQSTNSKCVATETNVTNKYLEKIASWEQTPANKYLEKVASFEESDLGTLSDLEKQAFFKAISKMFAKKPKAPTPPKPPKAPKPPAQPSTTPHNGMVGSKLSLSKGQMAANADKFKKQQQQFRTSKMNRLASGIESKLGTGPTLQ